MERTDAVDGRGRLDSRMGRWCAVNVDGEREGWLVRKPANVGERRQ